MKFRERVLYRPKTIHLGNFAPRFRFLFFLPSFYHP